MIKWIVVSSESVFLLFRALLLFLVFDVSSFSAVVLLIKSLIFCQIKIPKDFWKKSRKNFEKVPKDFWKKSRKNFGKIPKDFWKSHGRFLEKFREIFTKREASL